MLLNRRDRPTARDAEKIFGEDHSRFGPRRTDQIEAWIIRRLSVGARRGRDFVLRRDRGAGRTDRGKHLLGPAFGLRSDAPLHDDRRMERVATQDHRGAAAHDDRRFKAGALRRCFGFLFSFERGVSGMRDSTIDPQIKPHPNGRWLLWRTTKDSAWKSE